MGLKEKINEDLKNAMKSGDKAKLTAIRSIRASILELEKSGKVDEIKPEHEIQLLTSAVKKRKESIEQFEKAGRNDLVEKEKAELEVIQSYLPKQLTPEEVLEEVKKLADELGASTKADFPKLMPAAIQKLKGQTDGKTVKEAVEKILS
ncbi:MAG: GatB/YqeY domain-containing protein [Ignavibacteria bacterium]|nr:MAG: GatB/YqeY domain-containing protein [Ignavibacteria bacterium]